MKCLICYDVSETKIRNKVAKYMESIAVRIEYSVFLCDLAPGKIKAIKNDLLALTEKSEGRRLLMIPLCLRCGEEVWMAGIPLEKQELCVIA